MHCILESVLLRLHRACSLRRLRSRVSHQNTTQETRESKVCLVRKPTWDWSSKDSFKPWIPCGQNITLLSSLARFNPLASFLLWDLFCFSNFQDRPFSLLCEIVYRQRKVKSECYEMQSCDLLCLTNLQKESFIESQQPTGHMQVLIRTPLIRLYPD